MGWWVAIVVAASHYPAGSGGDRDPGDSWIVEADKEMNLVAMEVGKVEEGMEER